MTWNLFGQYLDIVLTAVLLVRVFNLKLQRKYLACLVFISFESLESLIYILDLSLEHRGIHVIDYRVLWFSTELVSWITTIWMMYSLLVALLRHFPGILKFSLRFLNLVFALCVILALITIRPEYAASGVMQSGDWLKQLSVLTGVVGRALSLAELLAILFVMVFILRFPIRVPRNLAAFSAGLAIYLFVKISYLLVRTYIPQVLHIPGVIEILTLSVAGCLTYWIFSINAAGETAVVTLGRGWQTVPQDHLIRQLEAMNVALLRSREQA